MKLVRYYSIDELEKMSIHQNENKVKTLTYGDPKLKPYNNVISTLTLNSIGSNTRSFQNGDAVEVSNNPPNLISRLLIYPNDKNRISDSIFYAPNNLQPLLQKAPTDLT